ncbi:uncharacterized protein LOC141609309 [Silene latifolia]|uniref:uncharacterized protein LOC141609309 n=1 Tax=Silene latifolia TaxID=37657 RepID=UPI003D771721
MIYCLMKMELNSDCGSDNEQTEYPTFNQQTDFRKPINLCLGLKFPNHLVFKKALRYHAIENGYDYYFSHNGTKRVTVYCKHRCACAWVKKRGKLPACKCESDVTCNSKVHGKKLKAESTFQVKSLRLKHTCSWTYFNSKVTSEFLAEKYVEDFRLEPHKKLQIFIQSVFKDIGVEIKYYKAYYAKEKAIKMIYGNDEEQYKRVWDYTETIKKHNPGSSMFVTLSGIDKPPPYFQRMYMCLDGCKKGFVAGCRLVVGLDGCHLKGAYSGQLLVAVSKDRNCNIFPIAWAVVEVENKDTWTWFLELLMSDVESVINDNTHIKHKDD